MTCEQVLKLVGAYHDGELTDALNVQEFEAHLATCPACARALAALKAVSSAVRERAPYFAASGEFAARIKALTVPVAEAPVRPPFWTYAGSLLAAACCGLLVITLVLAQRSDRGPLEAELVASHVRSLQPGHLFDVPSSDQHTVKPWFQGKLDFSPNVPDLSASGFPLLGGRLDYLNNHPAASLVYGRAKHVINVFVMHPSGNPVGGAQTADGYHLIEWREGDLDYWAVSDVNAGDLKEFAKDFQSASGPSR